MFFNFAQTEWTIQNIQKLRWLNLPEMPFALLVALFVVLFLAFIATLESRLSRPKKGILVVLELLTMAFLTRRMDVLPHLFTFPEKIPPHIPLMILGAVLLIYVSLMYWREKGVPLWGKTLLIGLRLALFFLCFVVLFQPILSFERQYLRDSYILILLDHSPSMAHKDLYGKEEKEKLVKLTGLPPKEITDLTRLQFLAALFQKEGPGMVEKILKKNHLRIIAFGDTTTTVYNLKKGSLKELDKNFKKIKDLKPKGKFTRLGQCLLDAKEELVRQGHRIASILIFTDGQSNAGISPIKVAEKLSGSRIPLYIFGIGNTKEEMDLEIFNLHTRTKAKVGDFIPFSLKLRARGFKNKDLHILLKKDGKVVHRQFAHIGSDSLRPKDVRFKYKVNKPGRYKFTLEVPVQKEESNKTNNVVSTIIEVKDKKLRVLYVEGYPRWEYRYLKNSLVRDRTLKVQCLLLSADQGYPQESSPEMESLRHYPNTTLTYDPEKATHPKYTEEQKEDILKQLRQYNVIIFGDVPPSHFNAAQMAATAQFVEEGGGFIMISGEKYAPHSFYGTPIASILPVILEKPDLVEVPLDETLSQSFRPKLTPEGERHIIMRFQNDMGKNKSLWEDSDGLPGFYWFSTVKKTKAGAIVLAAHPTRKNKYGPYPLFTLHNYGNGRVFFCSVDSTWRWRAGVGDRYFYTFWSQAIRHMATGSFQDKDKEYILTTGQFSYIQGKTVDIYAVVRKSKKKQWPVKVFGPYDPEKIQKLLHSARDENPLIEKKSTWTAILNLLQKNQKPSNAELLQDMGAVDNFEGEFIPYQRGVYFLQLAKPYVTPKGNLRGGDIKQILVTEYNKENLQVLLNETVLKRMAAITGGVYSHFFDKVNIQQKSNQKFSFLGKKQDLSPAPNSLERMTSSLSSEQEEITEVQKTIHLWKKWWILPIFLLLLVFEWVLRKFFRLL